MLRVAGGYLFRAQPNEFGAEDLYFLADGAPRPVAVADGHRVWEMRTSGDRLVFTRNESTGGTLWVVDPPYDRARQIWAAPQRALAELDVDPSNPDRMVMAEMNSSPTCGARADIVLIDARTVATAGPTRITQDAPEQAWPKLDGRRLFFMETPLDPDGMHRCWEDVASFGHLVMLDLETMQRRVVFEPRDRWEPYHLVGSRLYIGYGSRMAVVTVPE